MHIRKIALIGFATLSLTACAGLMQNSSLAEAHKQYAKGNYSRTLRLIVEAEAVHPLTEVRRAEAAYLKARSYEAMGRLEEARLLYRYLRDQHPESEYTYLAENRANKEAQR